MSHDFNYSTKIKYVTDAIRSMEIFNCDEWEIQNNYIKIKAVKEGKKTTIIVEE